MVFTVPPVVAAPRVPVVTAAVAVTAVRAVAMTAVRAVLPHAASISAAMFSRVLGSLAEAGAGKFPVSSPVFAPTAGCGGRICRDRSARRLR